jgi:hypothetical protein
MQTIRVKFRCAQAAGTGLLGCFVAAVLYFQAVLMISTVRAEDWTPTWSTATLSQPRGALAATSVGGKVFFGGGYDGSRWSNAVDIYDTTTGTWSTAMLSQASSNLAAASAGDKVCFAGGYAPYSGGTSGKVDIYDTTAGTWSTASLSQPRADLAATSAGDKVFFGGGQGYDNGFFYSNRVDIFDTSTGVWSTATLPQGRYRLSATSLGNEVFFGGGWSGSYSNAVDIFDTTTNGVSGGTLSEPRQSLSAASADAVVLFCGGDTWPASNTVDIYDTIAGTWSSATLSQARGGGAAGSAGNKILYAGGHTGTGMSNVVDIYDTSTGTWSTATLSQARDSLAAASAGNNVFFGGGQTGAGTSAVVDIYTLQNYSTITSSKAFTLTDNTTVVGRMQLNASGSLGLGNFKLDVGSMSGTAPIDLGNGTLAAGGDNSNTTYCGTISGNGALRKTGAGKLTLAGADVLGSTGGVAVLQGTLATPFGISHGGAGITLAAGATLEAGVSITRSVTGSGTLVATADLIVGNSRQAGQFNLGGAPGVGGTLSIDGNAVVLLSSDSAVLGSQTNLSDGGSLTTLHGVQLGGASSIDATKVLTATGDATVNGDFINNGLVRGPTGSGAWLMFTQDVKGAGSTTGNVLYTGSYSPGNSAAAVAAENIAFDPTSRLVMEIGGPAAGTQYDQLIVTGLASLGGTLQVDFVGGYQPDLARAYELIKGPTTGEFDRVLGLPSGWRVEYTAGAVTVVPEPSTLVLLAVGAVGLVAGCGWRRRFLAALVLAVGGVALLACGLGRRRRYPSGTRLEGAHRTKSRAWPLLTATAVLGGLSPTDAR